MHILSSLFIIIALNFVLLLFIYYAKQTAIYIYILLTPSTEDLVGPQPSHTSPQLFFALDQLSEA